MEVVLDLPQPPLAERVLHYVNKHYKRIGYVAASLVVIAAILAWQSKRSQELDIETMHLVEQLGGKFQNSEALEKALYKSGVVASGFAAQGAAKFLLLGDSDRARKAWEGGFKKVSKFVPVQAAYSHAMLDSSDECAYSEEGVNIADFQLLTGFDLIQKAFLLYAAADLVQEKAALKSYLAWKEGVIALTGGRGKKMVAELEAPFALGKVNLDLWIQNRLRA